MAHVSPDVDRGWAFVVVSSFFLTYVIIFGVAYTSSVFYTTFLDVFDQSPLLTAWVVNLVGFGLFFFGEVARVIIRAVGHRWTVVIASCLSSLGLFLSAFTTHLEVVLVTFGLMVGLGSALAYIVAIDMVSLYFIEHRAAAFVIGSSGAGFGQFLYAPLLVYLFDTFECSGGLIILSGIHLNLLVCAAIFMPPREATSQPVEQNEVRAQLIEHKEVRQEPIQPHEAKTRLRLFDAFCDYCQDLRVLSHPLFLIFCIGNGIGALGVSTFFTHISNFGITVGIDESQAATLASFIGIGSIASRWIMAAALRLWKNLKSHVMGLHVLLSITMGLGSCGCVFTTSYVGLAVCSAVFGASFCVWGLSPEACIHLLGVEKCSVGMSLASIASSVGMMIGGPFAAWLFEVDPSYRSSFLVGGLIVIVSGVMNFPAWITIKNRKITFQKAIHERTSLELSDL